MVIINSDAVLGPIIVFILLASSATILIYALCLVISVLRKGE